ncbi:alpha/beta hydrolase fold domain-containing protein [Streptomyces anulatus]
MAGRCDVAVVEHRVVLLGERFGGDQVSPYAAPARAHDLSGLPPAYVDVGELDLFRDENIAYANRLMQAGVPVELHVYPGGIHAAELLAPDGELSTRITAHRINALDPALNTQPAPARAGSVETPQAAAPPPGRGPAAARFGMAIRVKAPGSAGQSAMSDYRS